MASFHEGPRHATVTASDRGPLLNIATWILMVTSILFTVFRLGSNLALKGSLSVSDATIAVAVLLAVAQSIAVSFAVQYGIGQHQDTLSTSMLNSFHQSLLAADVLYVATIALSKLALLRLLKQLIFTTHAPVQRTFIQWSSLLVLLFLAAQVLTISFQCGVPRPGDYINGRCIDILAFWDFDACFNTILALVILAFPILIVRPLRMRLSHKFVAVSFFIFQLPICAFTIVRLVYLYRYYESNDRTWHALQSQLWTEINMHFSVVGANLPCLKIFFDSFNTRALRGADQSGSDIPIGSTPRSRVLDKMSNTDSSKMAEENSSNQGLVYRAQPESERATSPAEDDLVILKTTKLNVERVERMEETNSKDASEQWPPW